MHSQDRRPRKPSDRDGVELLGVAAGSGGSDERGRSERSDGSSGEHRSMLRYIAPTGVHYYYVQRAPRCRDAFDGEDFVPGRRARNEGDE